MQRILRITGYAIVDELHHKSFYALLALSALFVTLLRGCYHGDVVVNGQRMDAVNVGGYASVFAFHVIAVSGVLVGILLAMRTIRRDRENGTQCFIMSKAVHRGEYIIGKVLGAWIPASCFMFILHLTAFTIMWTNTGGQIPWYLGASLITSLNILFAVVLVVCCSTVMPDIMAALVGIVVCAVSFFADSFFCVTRTEIIKQMLAQSPGVDLSPPLWYDLWPKVTALQYFASSLIKQSGFEVIGPLHPIINVALYCVVALALLLWRFSREELA